VTSAPHAAHFKSDHAGADDTEFPRHLRHRQRTGVRQHQLFVEGRTGQRTRARAGGDDHMPAADRLRRLAGDVNLPAIGRLARKAAVAVKKFDLVLLEQEKNALVVLPDHLVLAREHFGDVDLETLDRDAVLRELMAGVFKVLGGLQQRL
jgi:hypothetical protein